MEIFVQIYRRNVRNEWKRHWRSIYIQYFKWPPYLKACHNNFSTKYKAIKNAPQTKGRRYSPVLSWLKLSRHNQVHLVCFKANFWELMSKRDKNRQRFGNVLSPIRFKAISIPNNRECAKLLSAYINRSHTTSPRQQLMVHGTGRLDQLIIMATALGSSSKQ